MKRTILIAVMTMLAGSVYGHEMFVDFGAGVGLSKTDLKFHNPTGAGVTLSPKDGDYILLSEKDNKNSAIHSYVSVGEKNKDNGLMYSLTLHNYEEVEATGKALFLGGNFEQKLKTSATGLFAGLGQSYKVSPSTFVEISGDVGLSYVESGATQGANIGRNNTFPSDEHYNFAWGVGAGVGFNLFPDLDLMVNVDYVDMGKADTGTTVGGGGMNANERLETELSFTSATISIRQLF